MKALQLGSLLLFAILVFSGCQADEEITLLPQEEEVEPLEFDPTLANEFTYQGETQTITDAVLIGDGERNPDGRITWQLYLVTEGLIESDGAFAGEGDFIFLDLNTGNPDGLVSSTYVLNGGTQQLTFNETSSLYENFDVLALTGLVTNIRYGEISIKVQGNQIIAEFDFNLGGIFGIGQDLPLKGQYQGEIRQL